MRNNKSKQLALSSKSNIKSDRLINNQKITQNSQSMTILPIKISQSFEIFHTKSLIKPNPQHQVKEQLKQTKKLLKVQQKDLKNGKQLRKASTVDVPLGNFTLKHLKQRRFDYNMHSKLKIIGQKISVKYLKDIKISKLRGVQQIDINHGANIEYNFTITNTGLKYLTTQISRFYQLKVLQIILFSPNNDIVKSETLQSFLVSIAKLKNLEKFNLKLDQFLEVSQKNINFLLSELLQSLTNLKAFYFSYSKIYQKLITSHVQKYEYVFSLCKSLEQISIKGEIQDQSLSNTIYIDFGRMQQLKVLRLDICFYREFFGSEKFKHLQQLVQLEEFQANIENSAKRIYLTQALFENLVYCTKLERLDLKFFRNVEYSEFKMFKRLPFLSWDNIDLILAGIQKFKRLRSLSLNFEDQQFKRNEFKALLKGLALLTNLETLSLKLNSKLGNSLTQLFMKYLSKIQTLKSLEVYLKAKFDEVIDSIQAVTKNIQIFKNLKSFKWLLDNGAWEYNSITMKVKHFRNLSTALNKCEQLENVEIFLYNFFDSTNQYEKQFSDLKMQNKIKL